jgi:tetratricopeptide (TPR) repeat protein
MNIGITYALLGLYKQARAGLERALQMWRALGDRTLTAYCLQNLGYVYWRGGDGRTARRMEEEALREFTAVGDAFIRAATLLNLCFIEEQAGDYALAGEYVAQAQQDFSRIGATGPVTEARAEQARCALAMGRLEQARQLAEEAWTSLREHGPKGMESPFRVYLAVAEVFDALGLTSEAWAATEAGYGELMSRADKISQFEWRRAFLENVEENRALVEMWERLSGSVSPLTLPEVPNS